MDMKLEVVVVPVSDAGRSKDVRVVQGASTEDLAGAPRRGTRRVRGAHRRGRPRLAQLVRGLLGTRAGRLSEVLRRRTSG